MFPKKIYHIVQNGRITSNSLQFDLAEEIIPIHLYRYNYQIQQLLKVKEIPEDKVDGDQITWKMFFEARNRKIKAFSDLINTLTQKEELLQFHNKSIEIEWNKRETIKIKKSRYFLEQLEFKEQIELLEYIKKSKKCVLYPTGVVVSNQQLVSQFNTNNPQLTESVKPNIESIRIEELKDESQVGNVKSDPVKKLKSILDKLAAEKFKEAGGTLDSDEEKLIK
ncbi:MAG: hypothetical protein CFE25_17155 [Chitinophagaceae bacterium BSSC1]|nr:MAG: hypothetical protein CFE25_17155 [Chitinophagaceae bacterium BSSC1]